MSRPIALTPTFLPSRPTRDGWVAYHDVAHMVGVAGLAMTWRDPVGALRYAAVLDREREGHVTFGGRLCEGDDVAATVGGAWREKRPRPSEPTVLATLLPYVGPGAPTHAAPGLPPIVEQAALARRAVAEAPLPPMMRAALVACLDKGTPRSVPLEKLRWETHRTLWPTLTLAVTDPWLVDVVTAAHGSLLANADPLAAIRGRWPGLTAAHLGRMRQPDAFPRPWRGIGRTTPTFCLDLLAACPVDWWPRKEGWVGFTACAQALGNLRDAYGDAAFLRDLASPSKGDWDAFAKRLCRAAGIDAARIHAPTLASRARECLDPVRWMTTTATLPLLAGREDDDGVALLEEGLGREAQVEATSSPLIQSAFATAGRLLYGEKSAVAILDVSREWHSRRQDIDSKVRGADGDLTWPVLFEGVFRHGDLGIVAVGSHAALRAEGSSGRDGDGVQGLRHCVATRLSECLSGRAHVLSVRSMDADGTWKRLSTCEVSVRRTHDGAVVIEVTEHKGSGNDQPGTAAVTAVSALAKSVAAGLFAVSEDATSPRRPTRRLEDLCGYDWRDPAAVSRAFEAWRPFLPRWARDLSPDDLRQELEGLGMMPALETPARAGPQAW